MNLARPPTSSDRGADSEDATSEESVDSFLGKVAAMPVCSPPGPSPPLTGRTIGRYRVGPKLGEGGMGQVHEAEDAALGRRVALKTLRAAVVADPRRRARLLREARSASRLQHPAIATVYEVGEADGELYLALELARGRPLRALIDEHPAGLSPARAGAIAGRIADALAAAHAAGVVHRDLKPENVVVGPDDDVKVLDFGLAKLLDEERGEPGAPTGSQLTHEGQVLGTPAYMAPEQAAGEPVGPAADVFSFGVLLYELLSGARPFDAATSLGTLVAISRDEPRPLRVGAAAKPLARVALRCLAKDPRARFPDGAAVRAALAAAGSSSRRPWRALALGAVALALGAAGVGMALAEDEVQAPPASTASSGPASGSVPFVAPPGASTAPAVASTPAPAASPLPSPAASARPAASTRRAPQAGPARPSAVDDPLAEQK